LATRELVARTLSARVVPEFGHVVDDTMNAVALGHGGGRGAGARRAQRRALANVFMRASVSTARDEMRGEKIEFR